jgi:hypothetical protein
MIRQQRFKYLTSYVLWGPCRDASRHTSNSGLHSEPEVDLLIGGAAHVHTRLDRALGKDSVGTYRNDGRD